MKCIKSHGGYSSCDKCWETGNYNHKIGKVILKDTTSARRTDHQFLLQTDDEHHRAITPLVELNVGLVSSFTIDYMHAVCLEVMKKLLVTWVSGSLQIRLSNANVRILSQHMELLRVYVPLEFNRKPRSLSELSYWKATEFRNFLLYYGPFVLRNNIDIAIYEHFLLLHVSISMLASSKHISTFDCNTAGQLLNHFVKHCEHTIY